MKDSPLFSLHKFGVFGISLALALICSPWASAQTLKNGDFESDFPVSDPTAGWALAFVESGPGDFSILGPTLQARQGSSGRGAHIRAVHPSPVHAYYRQIVTNCVPGASYTLTIQRMAGGFQAYLDNAKLVIVASLVSGASSNIVASTSTATTPYNVSVIAGANGQIEVQLHMKKDSMAADAADDFKSAKCSAFFDNATLALTP